MKRVALAHLRDDSEKKTAFVQFVVCNLDGKIEFRSEEFRLATYTGKDLEFITQITWSPDEGKLLVYGQGLAKPRQQGRHHQRDRRRRPGGGYAGRA